MPLHKRLLHLLSILIHVLVWLMFLYWASPAPVGLGQFIVEIFRPQDTLWFFLYGVFLNALMIYTYAHLVLPRYLKAPNWSYLLGANLLYILVFVAVESVIDNQYMQHIYATRQYPNTPTSLAQWMKTNLVISGAFMLVANFYGFTYGWFRSRTVQQELSQAKLKAELQALKHQINPHFLFNVLNGLYGLAFKHDDEATASGIAKLSQLMRYMLYDSNSDRVLLQREIAYLEDYIDLQRLRLSEQVRIAFHVTGQVVGREIAPMILIPFVENAFKHGVSTVHPTSIQIDIHLTGQQLHFQVRNPIHPGNRSRIGQLPGGIGLQNVKQRLEMLYPKSHQLDIDQANGIYDVTLTIEL